MDHTIYVPYKYFRITKAIQTNTWKYEVVNVQMQNTCRHVAEDMNLLPSLLGLKKLTSHPGKDVSYRVLVRGSMILKGGLLVKG